MPKIHVLPEILASQVAAGEVVERPASVVKELVENSIDAGAKHVLVEVQKGGTALVRVSDNGSGMSKDDALLSLERHATSKLQNSEQLMSIKTMGFRGEAVPSIASVSRFRLSTQERGAVEGTEILVDGGTLKEVKTAGLSDGTVVEAKQLFFNVPARRKFLKTESTESAHIEHQIRLHALSTPQVRFTFKKDGRLIYDLPSTHDRRVRIIGIMGQSVATKLIEIACYEKFGMQVSGYLLPSEFSRKGRRQQFIFLNGRPVEDPAISRALRDGYRGALAEGMHPSAWLWLEMSPAAVDVNVHPAKREVRFQRPHDVRSLVAEAVDLTLAPKESRQAEPKVVSRMDGTETPVRSIASLNRQPLKELPKDEFKQTSPPNKHEGAGVTIPFPKPSWSPPQPQVTQQALVPEANAKARVPQFEMLGILHKQYILMQGEEGLVVLDPKAARERIVYEEVMAKVGSVPSQGLLVPEVLELDAHDFDMVKRNLDHFSDAGIQIEEFGGTSFQVSGLPEFIKVKSPQSFVAALIDELIATQETKKGKTMAYDLFARELAKKTGLLEPVEMARVVPLLEQLFLCDLPYCDPAGEPTLVQIAMQELDRKFGKR